MSISQKKLAEALLRYDGAFPRYTSYPTAPHFSDAVSALDYKQWLQNLSAVEGPVSLYAHIPFCDQLCWYCGCNTKITKRYEPIERYVEWLNNEINQVADVIDSSLPVTHLHFGGGSPNSLSDSDFNHIVSLFSSRFQFQDSIEIAVEIDPRTFSSHTANTYAQAGVNRVSIGVQDFDPDVQEAINRVQSYDQVRSVVDSLRDVGINQINFDLLYGLPLQTTQSISKTIELATSLKPNRIALFGYAHVPWMKKHMRLIDEDKLPNGNERILLRQEASNLLVDQGYTAIGIDHFVREDDPMAQAFRQKKIYRNFQGYTTDNAQTLLAFGASSISALPQGYVQNHTEVRDYYQSIQDGNLPVKKGISVTDEDILRRKVIEQLMCYLQVDVSGICYEHGMNPDMFATVFESLNLLVNDGLLSIDGWKITILPEARQIVRVVAAGFDSYFSHSLGRHSRVA